MITRPADEPVDLHRGPHLFIDDYLIQESEGLARGTHPPQRASDGPILGWEESTTQPYVTVVRGDDRRFRMWYNHGIGQGCSIGYAESDDGMNWTTPKPGILGDSNRVLETPNSYGVSVIDEGPGFPDASRRFKLAWWGRKPPGLCVAFSPDGLHWTPHEGNPVLHDYGEESFLNDPRRPYSVSDIIDVYWDPLRERYAGFFKSPALESDGFAAGPRAGKFYRRLVTASISNDFIHWERPWRVMMPEERDPGMLEFYSVGGTIARGGLLIGFVRMLHDDFSTEPGGDGEGIGYTTLATSRDGKHWQRHDEIFFDRSPYQGAWDRAMTWVGSAVPVGDQLYLYYGGYKRGHKIEKLKERQLGLAIMPLDRFVSLDASGGTVGRLLTVPFKHDEVSGKRVVLNAAASGGFIRVQVLDAAGNPVPGATFADCEPVNGNHLALPVSGLDFSNVGSDPIRLEFEIQNAQLFAFDLVSE
jgi:hypothetical protein